MHMEFIFNSTIYSYDSADFWLFLEKHYYAMLGFLFVVFWFLLSALSAVVNHVDAFSARHKARALVDGMVASRASWADWTSPLLMRSDESIPKVEPYPEPFHPPEITHFMFLVHGHRGLSKDLNYMRRMMEDMASMEQRERFPVKDGGVQSFEGLVVHNAVCNEYKTQDGVENGGNRLVEEIVQVIEDEMVKQYGYKDKTIRDITFSLLGNSLGGLFGRYAIAKLIERHCVEDKLRGRTSFVLKGRYRLHLNIFCTTATPHLGISKHTFLPLPRAAEKGVALALGDTGRDLFRMNKLLRDMATDPTFLTPLSQFRKRIAYANAYGTDFAVPPTTAAFLSYHSAYPHHFHEDMIIDAGETELIIATLHTSKAEAGSSRTSHGDWSDDVLRSNPLDGKKRDFDKELCQMSIALDELGWTKVFVDLRRETLSVRLPEAIHSQIKGIHSHAQGRENDSSNLDTLKAKKVVASKEIANVVQYGTDPRLHLPVGHNMIVAFSRSRLSTLMNKGGRPVVNRLAKDLVGDIFAWGGDGSAATSGKRQRIR